MNYESIMADVLASEANSLILASKRIDAKSAELLAKLFQDLVVNQGRLVFCGVGKSGLVGAKCAATFTSLGLPSFFLHPTEALHGDLGNLREKDAVVLISYSGSAEEVIKLIPYLPVDNTRRIALVGNSKSRIAKECSIVFNCEVEKEACLNNQAPTTSSTLTMAMGDAMAVIFEHITGLSKEGFAQNHPAGKLGKSLRLKVKDLMIKAEDCPVLKEDQSLKEAIMAMTAKPIGAAVVTNSDSRLLGILVEGDIRRLLSQEDFDLGSLLKTVINTGPTTIEEDALASHALALMENRKNPFSLLPVVRDGVFLGVLRLHDLFKEGL
jgi:arabinose-5-phosphate isomerase